MNKSKTMMPERLCSLDYDMSLEKILQAKQNGTTLVGIAIGWNWRENSLEVYLGNNFYGFIPEKDVSVYPVFSCGSKFSPSTKALFEKPVVVNVVGVDVSEKKIRITLTRRENMLHAFDVIAGSIGKYIECCITAFRSFGIFVDAGNGLSGLIHYTQLTQSRFYDFSEMGLKIGDRIKAKVLFVDEDFQISLNYRDQFENLAFVSKRGELIEAKVLERINEEGFFAYLNPNTPALVDVPSHITCHYGDKIVARVKGRSNTHPDRLRLEFVEFVEFVEN